MTMKRQRVLSRLEAPEGRPPGRASSPFEAGTVKCSFCAKPQKDVGKLIAGPGVYICGKCVELCVDILNEGPGEAIPLTASTSDEPQEPLPLWHIEVTAETSDPAAKDRILASVDSWGGRDLSTMVNVHQVDADEPS